MARKHLLSLATAGLALVLTSCQTLSNRTANGSQTEGPSSPGTTFDLSGNEPRPNYAFSVVSHGVYTGDEAEQRSSADNLVRAHYSDLNPVKLKPAVLRKSLRAYVSYRKDDRIYWTSKPVHIRAGETVLVSQSGKAAIRARCGNKISTEPQTPVTTASAEPSEAELDRTLIAIAWTAPPALQPGSRSTLPANGHSANAGPAAGGPASSGMLAALGGGFGGGFGGGGFMLNPAPSGTPATPPQPPLIADDLTLPGPDFSYSIPDLPVYVRATWPSPGQVPIIDEIIRPGDPTNPAGQPGPGTIVIPGPGNTPSAPGGGVPPGEISQDGDTPGGSFTTDPIETPQTPLPPGDDDRPVPPGDPGTPTPEPGTCFLLAAGLLLLAARTLVRV